MDKDLRITVNKPRMYRVAVYETISGTYDIEATSEADAKSKVFEIISSEGLPENTKVRDIEFNATQAYLVPQDTNNKG